MLMTPDSFRDRMPSLSEADFLCQQGDTICGRSQSGVSVVTGQTHVTAAACAWQISACTSRRSSWCPPCCWPASWSPSSSSCSCASVRKKSTATGCRPRNRPPGGRSTASMVRAPELERWTPRTDDNLSPLSLFLSTAPPGINVLEHESIALDVPMSYSTFHPPSNYISKNLVAPPPSPPPETPSFTPIVQPRELPRQRLPESVNLVNPLPTTFSLPSDSPVSLYRARMDNRNVVLRVLNGETPPFNWIRWLVIPLCSPLSRLGQRHREARLPELCVLLGPAGTASLPARTSWRGVAPGSTGDSHGGAGEQRPAQLSVAMQRGRIHRRLELKTS